MDANNALPSQQEHEHKSDTESTENTKARATATSRAEAAPNLPANDPFPAADEE
jgi:hypothetical protein